MKISKIKIILYIFFIVSILCCKTKFNQTLNKQKEGIWIQNDTLEFIYKIVGKYSKDQEIGTWKHFYNNKLVRKEKYKKYNCKTKFYHSNGKLQKKGYTKSEIKNNMLHWFYYGNWKFYDTTGKFIKNVEYINGKTRDSLNQNYNEFKMRVSNTN